MHTYRTPHPRGNGPTRGEAGLTTGATQMPQQFLTALGLHIYRVPDFHKRAILALDAEAIILRDGLDEAEECRLLSQAADVLMFSRPVQATG